MPSCSDCKHYCRKRVRLFAKFVNWCRRYKTVPLEKCIDWVRK